MSYRKKYNKYLVQDVAQWVLDNCKEPQPYQKAFILKYGKNVNEKNKISKLEPQKNK